jgi:hypothetical protein
MLVSWNVHEMHSLAALANCDERIRSIRDNPRQSYSDRDIPSLTYPTKICYSLHVTCDAKIPRDLLSSSPSIYNLSAFFPPDAPDLRLTSLDGRWIHLIERANF